MTSNRSSEQNIERPHKGAAAISVFLCSDSSCWCWAEDRAKREQASRPSNLGAFRDRIDAYFGPRKEGVLKTPYFLHETEWIELRKAFVAPPESARDILQCLVDTCELATSAPWPALDEARAFLSGSPEEPEAQCAHTLVMPESTLTVIDPYKAKCRVCYEFFDLPLNGAPSSATPRTLTESERASFERAFRNSTRVIHEGEMAPEKPEEPRETTASQPKADCADCGLEYGTDDWLDTVLTLEQWKLIGGEQAGILCANCIVRRASRLPEVVNLNARITFRRDFEGNRDPRDDLQALSSVEPTRELSPSESASFDKTLARSPRRVPLRDSDAAFNLGVLPTEQPENGSPVISENNDGR